MGYVEDLRQFYYYQKYIWSATDFSNMQSWIYGSFRNSIYAMFGKSVVDGLIVTPGGGLNVQTAVGAAINEDGRFLRLATVDTKAVASPVGNPAYSLIVLRPVDTDTTNIPNPLNPGVNVPLHKQMLASVVVINGTPAAIPVIPSTTAGDVILATLLVPAATVTITQAMFVLGGADLPTNLRKKLARMTASATLLANQEIIEIDCTLGNVNLTLLSAISMLGKKISFVRIDATANTCTITAQGGELISGQAAITLDDQWSFVNMYSNGTAYRQV